MELTIWKLTGCCLVAGAVSFMGMYALRSALYITIFRCFWSR